jgi:putative tributyrin esterase
LRKGLVLLFLLWFTFECFAGWEEDINRLARYERVKIRSDVYIDYKQATDLTIQEIQIDSKQTGEKLSSFVILPPNYKDGQKYPVLYLLHGGRNKPSDWFEQTNLLAEYESLCKAGEIGDFILVLPESGAEGFSWYMNWKTDSKKRYEDYIIKELMPLIEKKFSATTNANGRGLSGISMGGFGALNMLLKHPDKFSSVSSFAGIINTSRITFNRKNDGFYSILWVPKFMFGRGMVREYVDVFGRWVWHWRKNNPHWILRRLLKKNPDTIRDKRFYLVAGTQDRYQTHQQQADVCDVLEKSCMDYYAVFIQGADHSYHVVDLELREVLKFHWDTFKRGMNGGNGKK